MSSVFLVSVMLLPCGSSQAVGRAAPSPLIVSVSVPALDERPTRELVYGGTFLVTIVNVSQQPQRVWTDNCSWGYTNLSLEFTDPADVEQKHNRRIVKKPVDWFRNVPRMADLTPGESIVFTVKFTDKVWQDLSVLETEVGKTVRMRVNYDVEPEKYSREKKVWTGSLKSAFQDYVITKPRL